MTLNQSSYALTHGRTVSWRDLTPTKRRSDREYVTDNRTCPCGMAFMGWGQMKYCGPVCRDVATAAGKRKYDKDKWAEKQLRDNSQKLKEAVARGRGNVCTNPACGRTFLYRPTMSGTCSVTCGQHVLGLVKAAP